MADAIQIASRLDRALKAAGHPVLDVSIGDPLDRATWMARFHADATLAQQDAVAAFIASFDPDAVAVVDAEKDALAATIDSQLLIQAVAQLDFEERQKLTVKSGQTLRTAQECRERVKAIYRSLL